MIGLAEPMKGVTRSGAFYGPKEQKNITMEFKKVQGDSKVIPTQFRIQRYKPLVENNGNK
jgi:hypothetical protein